MNGHLPQMNLPKWLTSATQRSVDATPFPIKDILENSLYYPASRVDVGPIRYLAGTIYSFIYVDYGVSSDELEREIHGADFSNYTIATRRDVNMEEIAPHGWPQIRPARRGYKILEPYTHGPCPILECRSDEDPLQYARVMAQPFARWFIMESKKGHHFSLLFVCTEGVSAFQAMYCTNKAKPHTVAIISSDGFACNWTRFGEPERLFGRLALNNTAGAPPYVLTNHVPWPQYRTPVGHYAHHSGRRVIFRKWTSQDKSEKPTIMDKNAERNSRSASREVQKEVIV